MDIVQVKWITWVKYELLGVKFQEYFKGFCLTSIFIKKYNCDGCNRVWQSRGKDCHLIISNWNTKTSVFYESVYFDYNIKAKILINVQFPLVTTKNYKTLFLIIPVIFTSSSL